VHSYISKKCSIVTQGKFTSRLEMQQDTENKDGEEVDSVSLTEHVLDIAILTEQTQHDGAGAISSFLGTTRDNFEGKRVISLEYEAYDAMALESMRDLCRKMRARWELKKIVIQHKIGACPVGHTSVFIGVSAAHRAEAIQACEYAINELKATVPVWKKEVYGEPATTTATTAAAVSAAWKANKEFVPKVPLHLLPAAAPTTPATTAAADAASAAASDADAQKRELLAQRLKDKLRKSACDAVAGEGGAALLAELNRLWLQDALIDEIGVVMSVEPGPGAALVLCSSEPRKEHKLGIPVSAMKPLFAYSVNAFTELLAELRRREADAGAELEKGANKAHTDADAEALQTSSTQQLSPAELSERIMQVTRAILVVRGDMPTALNLRKRLLLRQQDLAAVEAELALLAALFTLHPKSPSGWQHRRWCLCYRYRLQQQQQQPQQGEGKVGNARIVANMWAARAGNDAEEEACVQFASAQLCTERSLVDYINKRYPQNYYAWMHRVWVLQHTSHAGALDLKSTLEAESVYTHAWLRAHTSDHCAVNYLVQITQRACVYESAAAESTPYGGLLYLATPLLQSRSLLLERPGSEALWCLQRSLLNLFLKHVGELLPKCLFGIGEVNRDSVCVVATSANSASTTTATASKALSVDGKAAMEYRSLNTGAEANTDPATDLLAQRLKGVVSALVQHAGTDNDTDTDTARTQFTHKLLAEIEQFAEHQLDFVRHCCTDISVWNFQQHRLLAMRYAAFCLNSIREFCALLVPLTHRLCVSLSAALQHVCSRLAVEDTFERAWQALK